MPQYLIFAHVRGSPGRPKADRLVFKSAHEAKQSLLTALASDRKIMFFELVDSSTGKQELVTRRARASVVAET